MNSGQEKIQNGNAYADRPLMRVNGITVTHFQKLSPHPPHAYKCTLPPNRRLHQTRTAANLINQTLRADDAHPLGGTLRERYP